MKGIVSFEKNSNVENENEFFLLIDGIRQKRTGQFACGTPFSRDIIVNYEEMQAALKILQSDGDEYPFKIKKFKYNGFYGSLKEGFIKENARFLRWSTDPGVAVMLLNSGKTLFVPTFAIPGSCLFPVDETPQSEKLLFGAASEA